MTDDGYIKFGCKLIRSDPVSKESIKELNLWRNKMHDAGLIDMHENGIGFGNISTRIGETNEFMITGSATGGIGNLAPRHYARVIEVDFEKNSLVCKGQIKASSESMTHAAVYESDKNIMAVIHAHNLKMWQELSGKVPTTSEDATYGTPEMALEVMRIFRETNVNEKRILVMGGHEEGIITFGKTLKEAGNVILEYLEDVQKSS